MNLFFPFSVSSNIFKHPLGGKGREGKGRRGEGREIEKKDLFSPCLRHFLLLFFFFPPEPSHASRIITVKIIADR